MAKHEEISNLKMKSESKGISYVKMKGKSEITSNVKISCIVARRLLPVEGDCLERQFLGASRSLL